MAKVIIETSARHIHLTRADVETLFGAGYQLTRKKDLSQPGQFACEEKVTVEGPKGSLKMSILGPERPASQIEVSFTDARALGLKAPVRESGDIAGTPGVKLVGPCGEVELECGVIAAKRHIHITTADAAELGLKDKQIVSVKTTGDRSVTFHETVVRVSDKFLKRMHIDTDEANAAGISGEVEGEIIL
ncbi:PduL/EutD family phosphate acyltransferase [Acidaminobacterium chupaoyuni]